MFAYSDTVMPSQWRDTTELNIIRPATGDAANIWLYKDIRSKYKEVSNGQELWVKQWETSQRECVHGPNCKRANCEQGKAIQTVHILSGQFVVLWGFIHDCVPRGKHLRLVQVSVTGQDLTIMGVRIQASGIANLKKQLKKMEEIQINEVKKQEKLTEAYKAREEQQRLKEIERKKREREKRQSNQSKLIDLTAAILEYGREKRVRKTVYGPTRDPDMPRLIPLGEIQTWEKAVREFVKEEPLEKDPAMPALIPLTWDRAEVSNRSEDSEDDTLSVQSDPEAISKSDSHVSNQTSSEDIIDVANSDS